LKTSFSKALVLLAIITACFALSGCKEIPDGGASTTSVYKSEQAHTVANQAGLNQAQPAVTLKWSLERENINKRTTLWNKWSINVVEEIVPEFDRVNPFDIRQRRPEIQAKAHGKTPGQVS
jgi:hypothetical protein